MKRFELETESRQPVEWIFLKIIYFECVHHSQTETVYNCALNHASWRSAAVICLGNLINPNRMRNNEKITVHNTIKSDNFRAILSVRITCISANRTTRRGSKAPDKRTRVDAHLNEKKNKKIKSKKKIEISRIKMTGWLLRRRRRRCCCCCCIEVGNRCTLPTISLYTRTGQSSWKTIPIFALVSGWHQTIQSISIPFYPICTVYALHEANVSVFIWLRRRNSIKISLNSLFVVVVAYSVFAVELVWAHTV